MIPKYSSIPVVDPGRGVGPGDHVLAPLVVEVPVSQANSSAGNGPLDAMGQGRLVGSVTGRRIAGRAPPPTSGVGLFVVIADRRVSWIP